MLLNYLRTGLLVALCFCLTSCFDVFEHETTIYGPYYVADDPSASYQTLYYRLNEGLSAERFQDVSQVGYKLGYVFIKSENRFYWFAVKNDKPTDLGDSEIKNLVSRPLTQDEFNRLLFTLKIDKIDFQFSE